MNATTERFVTDMQAVAADVREPITATAEHAAGPIVRARERTNAALAKVQSGISAAQRAAAAKARAADGYVHASPWPFIGTAVLLGVAIGVALARR